MGEGERDDEGRKRDRMMGGRGRVEGMEEGEMRGGVEGRRSVKGGSVRERWEEGWKGGGV